MTKKKKFIDLKSKTKYTSPKNSSTTKITNSKTKKKKKKAQLTNFINNKQPCPLKNYKQK